MYKHTQTFFSNSEIKSQLLNFTDKDKKNKILEIGSFEGLCSSWLADNLLNHKDSLLVCVDPFLNINNNDHAHHLRDKPAEENFDYNIKICENSEKIQVNKITSDEFFKINKQTFNIIYVDGCHILEYIERDVENAFNALEECGIMWMDDYMAGYRKDGTYRPDLVETEPISRKNVIDKVLEKYKDQFEIIHPASDTWGYQLGIKKH